MLTRHRFRHRASVDHRADPYYGYGYRPDWPSVLSVAHDENDGAGLFVITDRPCVLSGAGLPLIVPVAAPLWILTAVEVLPVKFRLAMSDAVPQGADWRWLDGPSMLIDPVSGHGPNAASGVCADVAGPYTPPPPAVVINAGALGNACTLEFDRPVMLSASPPPPPDDAMLFDGQAALAVSSVNFTTLRFDLGTFVSPGGAWEIVRQPDWVRSALAVPQSGTF